MMAKKVLVVGGVAAGASAAARLRRLDEDAEIIMFEKGPYISFANCGLPYYVGGVITERNNLLLQTPRDMKRRFNIDVRVMNEVTQIIPAEKKVEVCNRMTDESYRETYDYLILAPGAEPLIPPLPGIDKTNVFIVRNVPDSDAIKNYIMTENPRTAVVIGGGFIGLEMAEMLMDAGLKVSLLEMAPQVMRALDPEMADILHSYLKFNGLDLRLSSQATAFEGEDRVMAIRLADGSLIPSDLVVLGLGVKPAAGLAKEAGLKIGSTGAIWVDEYLRTSDPFIYAGGDAVQVKDFITGEDSYVPLAGPANRQGWLIANNICGRSLPYKGAQGSAILKFRNMTIAATGKNEYELNRAGIKYLTCHIHPNSHATYYPGATQMTAKLLFTPDNGKILGAQIVGSDGVDKRIDVLATAIRAGMNVFDLQELELAYAPPYSSAKDPVNMLAYVAGNMLNGDIEVTYWTDVAQEVSRGAFLIDARTPEEFKYGAVEGATNIPVDEIRNRLAEIPKDRDILVYCQVGLRSYITTRILKQNNFKVKNISGGYKLYEVIRK
ncbi:FAD-dependent pyridine nucleotide-disulphide oxidoreductase [Syntrophomonas zehnderi OL-4]|uniref:FAD-dependent pyridine nucleotide-disulphide oxidoreductase n=1 Tax=Syntrophomonas zehnderi OL-4 TaxID=690567 RepID=A0A0E4GAR9_9FIRM|nr:FAD-dependent oxidoreductase [Syntrophomonas zehnderi]CFX41775.1 FAD-dependent pyridine nucleotide-disulphide oxidoreductase [Syntrophomonas zehnderi OL-4]